MWFETLVGFDEENPQQVRANLTVANDIMTSTVNGRRMRFGNLETPSLSQLWARIGPVPAATGRLKLSEVVADVQQLHAGADNANALFQVASQFNLLEMVSPAVSPEDGVGCYEYDRTQGPACAIACGAGTIYRNYFAPVNGQLGQTEDNQINCLHDLGIELGNSDQGLWEMKNGYALAMADGLAAMSERILSATESQRDHLRKLLRIGLQWNTEVTIVGDPHGHTVSQAFCSALPVAYCSHPQQKWAPFAQLVLEASYEATLCAGVLNFANTGNNRVYLTLLGGGAFGNHDDWIFAAIGRAVHLFSGYDLDVVIVSYRESKPRVQQLLADYSASRG